VKVCVALVVVCVLSATKTTMRLRRNSECKQNHKTHSAQQMREARSQTSMQTSQQTKTNSTSTTNKASAELPRSFREASATNRGCNDNDKQPCSKRAGKQAKAGPASQQGPCQLAGKRTRPEQIEQARLAGQQASKQAANRQARPAGLQASKQTSKPGQPVAGSKQARQQ
jgi:hypothetical protein